MKIINLGPCARHNASASPIKCEGVLLHTTEGGGKSYLDSLFVDNVRDDGVVVSVHFCIFKDGSIHNYAPWEPGAAWYCYHAGKSRMPDGRASASRYLLGIELQHMSGQTFPRVQLDALTWLLLTIQSRWQGKPSWKNVLLDHKDVAPERKSDPTYPWPLYRPTIHEIWSKEVDLTEKERALLDEIHLAVRQDRVTNVKHSNDTLALLAQLRGDPDAADRLLAEAEAAAREVREALKL